MPRPGNYVVSSWLLASLIVAYPLLCQQPADLPPVVGDSTAVGREAWPVYDATVVAIVPREEADTAFARARAVARDLGFQFAVTASATILDVRSGAVYYLPSNVTRGFVVITPGRPPDLVRGVVSPTALEKRIRAYRDAPRTARPDPPPAVKGAGGS